MKSHQPMIWFDTSWNHGKQKRIAFLDLDVVLSNGRLESAVHVKPTDRHQDLHYSSSHPE